MRVSQLTHFQLLNPEGSPEPTWFHTLSKSVRGRGAALVLVRLLIRAGMRAQKGQVAPLFAASSFVAAPRKTCPINPVSRYYRCIPLQQLASRRLTTQKGIF